MLKEMIVKKSRKYSVVITPFIWFICAFVTVFATKENITAPLICALAGTVLPVSATAVSVAGMLGYMALGTVFENGFIICSLILITAGKWIIRDDSSYKTAMFITFVSMAFSGIVFGLVVDGDFKQTAINILYAVICPVSVYFVMQVKDMVSQVNSIPSDKKSLMAITFVYILACGILCGAEIFFINIGIAFSCFVILCACRFFGCRGGVICGVLATVSVAFGNTDLASETVFFGVAGLVSGLMSSYSRITIATVFSGVVLLGQFAIGMNDYAFFVQSDIITASLAFLLVPEAFVTRGGRICSSVSGDSNAYLAKEMEFASKSLADIRENVNGIMKLFANRQKSVDSVSVVSEKVCSKCRNRLDCWEKKFERTNEAFHKFEKQNSFPVGFECVSKDKITEEFENCRKELLVSKIMSARLSENRNFLFSQMQTSEELVNSLSAKLSVCISESMSTVLCRTLEKYSVEYSSAIVFTTHENRLIAEIYMPESNKIEQEEICDILSHELGVLLEYSEPFTASGETRYRFNQKTRYTVEISDFGLSANDGEPSGDTCGYFTDGLGFAYAYLSDGMGSGSGASLSSKLTAKLFRRFIRLGMSCEGTVRLVNSIMLTKSGEESFATLDIAKINLETGGVTLYKSGASATLIKYNKGVMMFSFPSNPVGIIPDMKISEKKCDFSEGDVLVMMSDGVPENSYLYIKEQLVTDTPLDKLSENICNYARKISQGKHADDVTALSIKFIKNSNII